MNLRALTAAVFFLSAGKALAGTEAGYVVKVDSAAIYIDLGESNGAAAGQEFTVFIASSELKHPVTGESLGFIETPVGHGRIEQVLPKYSIGHIVPGSTTGIAVAAGQRARLIRQPINPPLTPEPTPQGGTVSDIPLRQPVWRSPAVEIEATDLAVADIDGDGKPEIVLIDQNHVQAYSFGDAEWKLKCSYEDKSTGVKFLSVDAADLNANGKAELFVSLQNAFFNRVETTILECKDSKFEKLASQPWLTRAHQDPSGKWVLAGQQLVDDATFPFGNIYPIEYKDGKYVQSSPAIKLKRVDWVYGFTTAQETGATQPFHLFYTNADRIRIQPTKGSWVSPDNYGQTATRIRWHDRPLKFYSRLLVDQAQNETYVYAVKNIPIFGSLADAFGLYGNAELYKMHWTGLALEPAWKANLAGYAADVTGVKPGPSDPQDIFVAVVGKTGKTSVWKFVP